MPYGIDTVWLLIGGGALLAGVFVILIVAALARVWRGRRNPRLTAANEGETVHDGGVIAGNYDALASDSVTDPDVVEIPPPDLKGSSFGLFGEMLSMWRRVRKRRRMAKKGYVQWYLIDETFPSPKFIKPELKGGGIPELKYKGNRYLFPKDGKLPAEQQGLWTYIHKKGEADPIKLDDPLAYAIDADELQEYLTKRVTSSPPGLLDRLNLNLSPQQIMAFGIVGIIVLSVLMRVM